MFRRQNFLTANFSDVAYLEVEDVLAGGDCLLELLALGDLPGVAVNEEALGAAQLAQHRLGQQVQHSGLESVWGGLL